MRKRTKGAMFAGAANLYNREFYRLVHDRLGRGGVLQQWVQLHHIAIEDVFYARNVRTTVVLGSSCATSGSNTSKAAPMPLQSTRGTPEPSRTSTLMRWPPAAT